MPVTLQKKIWMEGRTNLSHLGKITTIFFLIFNTQFKHVQLLLHFTQFLCSGARTRSNNNYKHWVKALHKNTIHPTFPRKFLKYHILSSTSAAIQEFLGNFCA